MRSLVLTGLIGLVAYLNVSRAEEVPAPAAGDQVAESAPKMITVDVKLIQVSQTKMRELGITVSQFNGKQVAESTDLECFDQVPSSAINGFVDALVKNKIAYILSSPRVTTLEHQEASLSIGSQVERTSAGNTHYVQRGTRLSVAPEVLGNNSVRLDFLLEWSGSSPTDLEPKETNNTRNFEIRTSTITPLGQSTLLSRSLESTKGNDETVLLLIVTPEVIETTANVSRAIAK